MREEGRREGVRRREGEGRRDGESMEGGRDGGRKGGEVGREIRKEGGASTIVGLMPSSHITTGHWCTSPFPTPMPAVHLAGCMLIIFLMLMIWPSLVRRHPGYRNC